MCACNQRPADAETFHAADGMYADHQVSQPGPGVVYSGLCIHGVSHWGPVYA